MRISDLSSDVCSSDLLGIELTTQEWQSLAAIDAAPATEKTRIGLTFPRTLNELESDQLLRASVREYEAPANQLDMPLSDERVALVSVTYNRGVVAIMGNGRNVPEHPIMDAIDRKSTRLNSSH